VALLLASTEAARIARVRRKQTTDIGALVGQAAEELENGPSKEFLNLIRPCAPCSKFERIGEGKDGGYIMCTDDLNETLEGAFSFGIYGFDGWGMEASRRYKIPVHEYDCYNQRQPRRTEGADSHFHAQCIGPESWVQEENDTWTTFSREMTKHGVGKADRSILLKMDIEGAEVDMLVDEPIENLKKVRQLAMELHNVDIYKVDKFLNVARRLRDAGFAVAHLHGNNCCPSIKFGEFSIPSYMEMTWVLAPSEGCVSGLPMRLPLDKKVLPDRPEVADPVLPDVV